MNKLLEIREIRLPKIEKFFFKEEKLETRPVRAGDSRSDRRYTRRRPRSSVPWQVHETQAGRTARCTHNAMVAMLVHGDSQHECPPSTQLRPRRRPPAGDGGVERKAKRRGAQGGVAAALASCGVVLMLLESCSAFGGAFVSSAGGRAALWRPPHRRRAAVHGLRTDGRRTADLRCTILVPPVYSFGDWGKIVKAGEDTQKPRALPRLTQAELQQLHQGERVQRQSRVGRVGHGLVVMDVEASISTVLAVLSDVQRYPQRIGIVREAVLHPGGSRNLCKARFHIWKFDVHAELHLNKKRNMLEFQLDKSAAGSMQGAVFDEARGYWYLEACPERPEGWTRVWLNARVQCSPLLPSGMIDYAASKALPRATTWLGPVCQAIERELASGPLGGVNKDVSSLGLGLPLECV